MSIKTRNNRLLPFVLFVRIDFIKLNGQLIPNKISIVASRIFAIITNSFCASQIITHC